MSWLPPEDLRVFGFEQWLEALKRGVSSHHAGHLPIFKEVVEDLFQQGLVKVIFATETLSLGINMPAKTVVIESLYKFSGESHEFLTPTEYTQLTGRAGRRGIDKVGNAVILYNPIVSFNQVQKLAEAESVPIRSSFSISYNMAVNLLRFYDMETAVHVLNSSFAQFHADRDVVKLEKSRGRLARKLRTLSQKITCERGNAREYFELRSSVSRMEREMAEERKRRRRELVNRELEELLVGDVIVLSRKGLRRPAVVLSLSEDKYGNPRLNTMDDRGHYLRVSYHQFPVPPQTIGHLGTSFIPASTKAREKRLRQALQNFEVPPPDEWEEGTALLQRAELTAAQEELRCNVCESCRNREQCMQTCQQMQNVALEIERIERQMELRSEVSSRRLGDVMRILNRLGYVEDSQPTAKGIVLSRLYNECDLLLVECLEGGVFDRLDPIELACFSSIFVYESRESPAGRGARGRGRAAQEAPTAPTPELQEAITTARARESQIKSLEARQGLDLLRQPDAGFIRVVYDWASGEDLEYISSVYPQYSPGDFVRNMKQVIDIMRQIKEVTEDPVLKNRISEAMERIHRSIVAYTSVVDVLQEELESV
jgi:ATP-dependent RNA helicase HelY